MRAPQTLALNCYTTADICPDTWPGHIEGRISVQIKGSGCFENFVDFVWIGTQPFSKFLQNPSGLLPGLPYHNLGSCANAIRRGLKQVTTTLQPNWDCLLMKNSLIVSASHSTWTLLLAPVGSWSNKSQLGLEIPDKHTVGILADYWCL